MKRGQVTIIGIIMLIIALVMFTGTLPLQISLINSAMASADDFSKIILAMIIPIEACGIIMGFLQYVMPSRERPPPGYGRGY